jgi:hypothetical protein
MLRLLQGKRAQAATPLVRLKSAYRRIEGPLLQFIEATESDHPRRLIAVLIPE